MTAKEKHPEKPPEKEASQQLATCLVPMYGLDRGYEAGEELMIEEGAYVPGQYRLRNREVQRKWDLAYRKRQSLGG